MFCPNCGSQWKEQDKFCPGCGKTIEENPEPTASISSPLAQNQTVSQFTGHTSAPAIQYTSRLLSITRNPLFFIAALLYLADAIWEITQILEVLPYFSSQIDLFFFPFCTSLLDLIIYILVICSLLLHAISALTKTRGCSGAACSLFMIAMSLQIISLVLRLPNLIDNISHYSDYGYYDLIYFVSNLVFIFPLSLLATIFAMRANSIARAMNNGQDAHMGAGPSIMFLIFALTAGLLNFSYYYMFGYAFSLYLQNIVYYFIPTLAFAILLLLKPKKK